MLLWFYCTNLNEGWGGGRNNFVILGGNGLIIMNGWYALKILLTNPILPFSIINIFYETEQNETLKARGGPFFSSFFQPSRGRG